MSGIIGQSLQVKSGVFGFPTGHIIGVFHSGFTNAQENNAGDRANDASVNFNRVLNNSHFIVTVMCSRYRDGTGGRLRIGYTRGVGSLSTTYIGQASNSGEEDGTRWHNVSVTYKDTTTGSAGDNIYFGTHFSNTTAGCFTRGAGIMVMEVVS